MNITLYNGNYLSHRETTGTIGLSTLYIVTVMLLLPSADSILVPMLSRALKWNKPHPVLPVSFITVLQLYYSLTEHYNMLKISWQCVYRMLIQIWSLTRDPGGSDGLEVRDTLLCPTSSIPLNQQSKSGCERCPLLLHHRHRGSSITPTDPAELQGQPIRLGLYRAASRYDCD